MIRAALLVLIAGFPPILASSVFVVASVPAFAQVEKPADDAIDFVKARALLQKRQRGGTLTADEEAYVQKAMAARRAGQGSSPGNPPGNPGNRPAEGSLTPRESIGQKPLNEMTADDHYKNEDGGLYGNGRNAPPDSHQRAAEAQLARIQPLNTDGQPGADGRIVFLSISMSNATQEFSRFKRIADADSAKSGKVTIVDGAQGGQAMAEWVSPDARPWAIVEQRLAAAGVTAKQVQVAWIKLANKGPRGDLADHGKTLQRDTQAVIQNARSNYPNLRIAYLSSRIYGGYATGALNP